MLIDPKTMRELRDRAGMTQAQLGERAKVAARTIQRIETSEGQYQCRQHQAESIAKALGTTPAVLAGGKRSVEEQRALLTKAGLKPLRMLVREDYFFYLGMIELTYGVQWNDVIELAPLLFAIVAEKSLAERLAAAKEMETALNALTAPKGHPQLTFMNVTGKFEDALASELESIAAKDIFATKVSEFADEVGEIAFNRNPFTETVKRMVADSKSDVLEIASMYNVEREWPLGIEINAFTAQLETLTGGDPTAIDALIGPEARPVTDIPKELLTDDRRDDRIRWLNDQVSIGRREALEQQAAQLAALLSRTGAELNEVRGNE